MEIGTLLAVAGAGALLLGVGGVARADHDDYGGGYSHRAFHDYLDDRHADVHDRLHAEHRDLHRDLEDEHAYWHATHPWASRRAHRREHGRLEFEHSSGHRDLDDEHARAHDRLDRAHD